VLPISVLKVVKNMLKERATSPVSSLASSFNEIVKSPSPRDISHNLFANSLTGLEIARPIISGRIKPITTATTKAITFFF